MKSITIKMALFQIRLGVRHACKRNVLIPDMLITGFSLYFGIKIQGLSRAVKLHFQGPILDGSLQHGQNYSNI